jgi:3-deoxy-D-manno-octulosonic-acid transferase
LDAVQPTAVGLVELEVWPNFIRECARREIPVGVINGRLSARSFKGYRKIRPVLRRTFASLAFAGVQDQDYFERFEAMGVPRERLSITGTMKWDAAKIQSEVPGAAALGKAVVIGPAVSDFANIVAAFERAGGIVKVHREEVAATLRGLIGDAARRRELAVAAVECVRQNQGASQRSADLLLAFSARRKQ